jgi:beta-glucanase (GH16 family)
VIASFDRFYFQYGYVEIRAQVPKGQGLWPAVWLLAQGADSAEEIDIMEVLGGDPGTVHTTIHYKRPTGQKMVKGYETHGTDFSADFHTYAVDWEWDKIVWFIDGKEVFRVTDHVPHEPMYLIANLAVGGAWPGYPDQTTQFPATFRIDFIRVFTH